ncbi:MAG: hypothetical protein WBN30_10060, partial [Polyangiales bacterium]
PRLGGQSGKWLVAPGQDPDRPERRGPERLPFESRQSLGHGRLEVREPQLGCRSAKVAEVASERRLGCLILGRNAQDLG